MSTVANEAQDSLQPGKPFPSIPQFQGWSSAILP